MAEGQARVTELNGQGQAARVRVEAEADAARVRLMGEAEATKVARIGEAEAEVNRQKVAAFGDGRLYALNLVTASLAESKQPLVPEKLIIFGGSGENGGASSVQSIMQNILQSLLALKETEEPKNAA